MKSDLVFRKKGFVFQETFCVPDFSFLESIGLFDRVYDSVQKALYRKVN